MVLNFLNIKSVNRDTLTFIYFLILWSLMPKIKRCFHFKNVNDLRRRKMRAKRRTVESCAKIEKKPANAARFEDRNGKNNFFLVCG